MSIPMDETLLGLWMVGLPGVDWLAGLNRGEKAGEFRITYRFRYHADDNPFSSKDRKSWYAWDCRGLTTAQAIERVRAAQTMIRSEAASRTVAWELLRGERSPQEFMALVTQMPGMHHKTIDCTCGEAMRALHVHGDNCPLGAFLKTTGVTT